MKQEFESGKYTVIFDEKTGALRALRYGEPWQDLSGNKMVYCMLSRVEELAEQRAELLGALQEMVEFFQPNACGSEDNKRDALNGAFRILNKIEVKP